MIELKSSQYDELEIGVGSEYTKGDFVPASMLGGSLCGFIGFTDVVNTDKFVVVVKASRARVTKVPGDSLEFLPGEKVRYDATNGKATKTASYPLIGYAKARAQQGEEYVDIIFDGSLEALSLTDLADVVIDSPKDNQVLKYEADDSLWHNAADAT